MRKPHKLNEPHSLGKRMSSEALIADVMIAVVFDLISRRAVWFFLSPKGEVARTISATEPHLALSENVSQKMTQCIVDYGIGASNESRIIRKARPNIGDALRLAHRAGKPDQIVEGDPNSVEKAISCIVSQFGNSTDVYFVNSQKSSR